jgi:hypothetical protein
MEAYSYWDFIEENLPDYSSNQDVCLSNDIAKMIDEPDDASDECRRNVQMHVADIGNKDALTDLLIETDAGLFKEALRNYLKTKSNDKRGI